MGFPQKGTLHAGLVPESFKMFTLFPLTSLVLCGRNEALLNLRGNCIDVLGDERSPQLPWLEPPKFTKVCIYRILSSSLGTCGIVITGGSYKRMLGSIKLQGIGYFGSFMVGTLRATVLVSVMPYKMEGANSLKALSSEEREFSGTVWRELGRYRAGRLECGKCACFV